LISNGALFVGAASFIVALVISAALTPIVRLWALRRGFIDRPLGENSHKTHEVATPFGGGIAITIAIVLPQVAILVVAVALSKVEPEQFALFSQWLPQWPHWLGGIVEKASPALAFLAGAIVLFVLGLIDDHWPLSPWSKLIVQAAVALMLTAGFGIRAGEALGAVPSVILTTLWIVALTNAFNFLDNMDGLAAGVAGITAIVLAGAAFVAGQVFVPCMLLLTAGAVCGFLFYNFPSASIFMGDAGSLVIGYSLAVSTVLTTFYDPEQQCTPFGLFVPLVVFAIPIYDMLSVIFYRYRLGASIFRSDHRHFSHRLKRRGMSVRLTLLTIYLATAATALPAMLLPRLNWAGATLVFGQCLCVVALIAILESRNGD